MNEEVCLLLTKYGKSLKVYLNSDNNFELITTGEALKHYPKSSVVRNYKPILINLISSKNSMDILCALKKLLNEIQGEKLKIFTPTTDEVTVQSLLRNGLSNKFLFLHEQTAQLPNHKRGTRVIPNISGHLEPFDAHDESLEDLIQFLEEYCFDEYKNEQRKLYVQGYRYQRTSWLDPSWVTYRWNKDPVFEEGRNAARLL